ncbi:uncharacterized protein LOC142331613 [Lycorma delicatula]|uniref:uncharacterized protein LOC142331613 n=1 Tax=Lycorma delicatula TaxID=130591 RepID=UPI003F50EA4F
MFKEVIQILIDNGVNINIHNENNNTLLLYILKNVNNNKEHVSFVIQKGADVNICDNNGFTPIMYVILFDKHVINGKKSIKTEIMSTLIEIGAYIDAIDKDGRTSLCHAFQRDYDNDDILVLLLDCGASVRKYLTNLRESKTPLISVCNNFSDVKILIEPLYGKEDINENDTVDHTSFLSRLYSRHVELCHFPYL